MISERSSLIRNELRPLTSLPVDTATEKFNVSRKIERVRDRIGNLGSVQLCDCLR